MLELRDGVPRGVWCRSRRHAAPRAAARGWAPWLCKSPAIYLRCASSTGHIACFVANAFAFHTRKVVTCRSRTRRPPPSRLVRFPSRRPGGRRAASCGRAGGARGGGGARRNASTRRPAIRAHGRSVGRAEAEGAVQWDSLEARVSPDGHDAARSGEEVPPGIWAAAAAVRSGRAGDRDRGRVPDAAGTACPWTAARPRDRGPRRSWHPASRPSTGCVLWQSPPSSCYAVW